MPDGKIVGLTVVGADDEATATGITRGWYATQVLDAESVYAAPGALSLARRRHGGAGRRSVGLAA